MVAGCKLTVTGSALTLALAAMIAPRKPQSLAAKVQAVAAAVSSVRSMSNVVTNRDAVEADGRQGNLSTDYTDLICRLRNLWMKKLTSFLATELLESVGDCLALELFQIARHFADCFLQLRATFVGDSLQ